MARWKLVTAHYLKVDGIAWEYQETDRTTGRPKRTQFPVPQFLDPRDPADCNYKWGTRDDPDGEIIVCLKGKGEDKDIVFYSDPTPDMIPLDDEAKAISASYTERWRYKPETDIPGQFSQSLVDKFQANMEEARSKPTQIEGLTDLVTAMATIAQQNQAMLAALTKDRRL